jgi:hypothetical protein
MLTLLIVLALFIVLDLAALRWGVDSTERVDSCEWDRRPPQRRSRKWAIL